MSEVYVSFDENFRAENPWTSRGSFSQINEKYTKILEQISTSQKVKNEYYTTILKMGEKEVKSSKHSQEVKSEEEE